MRIENLDIYPSEDLHKSAEVIELFSEIKDSASGEARNEAPITTDSATYEARREALVASGVSVIALTGTVMFSDLIDNKHFTQVSLATVGTGVVLALSYYTEPYLSNTRLGRLMENWVEPRRIKTEEAKLQKEITSTKDRETRDLKRKILKNSNGVFDKKVKLYY